MRTCESQYCVYSLNGRPSELVVKSFVDGRGNEEPPQLPYLDPWSASGGVGQPLKH